MAQKTAVVGIPESLVFGSKVTLPECLFLSIQQEMVGIPIQVISHGTKLLMSEFRLLQEKLVSISQEDSNGPDAGLFTEKDTLVKLTSTLPVLGIMLSGLRSPTFGTKT